MPPITRSKTNATDFKSYENYFLSSVDICSKKRRGRRVKNTSFEDSDKIKKVRRRRPRKCSDAVVKLSKLNFNQNINTENLKTRKKNAKTHITECDDYKIIFRKYDLASCECPLKIKVLPKKSLIKKTKADQKRFKKNLNVAFKCLLNGKNIKIIKVPSNMSNDTNSEAKPVQSSLYCAEPKDSKNFSSNKCESSPLKELNTNCEEKEFLKTLNSLAVNTLDNENSFFKIDVSPEQVMFGFDEFYDGVKDLNEQNNNELKSSRETLPDKKEKESDKKINDNNYVNSRNSAESPDFRFPAEFQELEEINNNDQDLSTLDIVGKISLKFVVEQLIVNFQDKDDKNVEILKKGLCSNWLANNYSCENHKCTYFHNAFKLFLKKLENHSSKLVMSLVFSMRNDVLFVDAIMAAFKIFSSSETPLVWVVTLVYFVFYVIEPSDCRFLKFWANAARYFCQNYTAARGFASLLAIFNQGEESEEWKIPEFIKLIKNPPIQIRVTYDLLQPILNLKVPLQFLLEAVEFALEAQDDLLKVYLLVIPKISIMTSPIHVIELLLKFCTVLENANLDFAESLRHRLLPKVQTYKTKILEHDFPLTAAFQSTITKNLEKKSLEKKDNLCELMKSENDEIFKMLNCKKNYFNPDHNMYTTIVQNIGLNLSLSDSLKSIRPPTICYDLEKIARENQLNQIKQFFDNCRFDLLGKFFNELRPDVVFQAAETFLKMFFQMKITLQQAVDLVKTMIYSSRTENSALAIASISLTFILNLVKINEWSKANTLICLCNERKINLIEGMVCISKEFNSLTQLRIVLLILEVYAYKENFQNSLELIKRYNLHSPHTSLWKLNWVNSDKIIRIKLLEEVLSQIISSQHAEYALELFLLIWKEQKNLLEPVNLQKFANGVLILLLNQNNEKAIDLFDELQSEFDLHDVTLRAVLVTLKRHNRLIPAERLKLYTRRVYALPTVKVHSKIVLLTISSFWLEEELYIVFDAFLKLLVSRQHKKRKVFFEKSDSIEVFIKIRMEEPESFYGIMPLCLGLINSSFEHTCTRIQRVLQYQFTPPIYFDITPENLKIDGHSLQKHLQSRSCLGQDS